MEQETVFVIMLKNKETGFLEKELGISPLEVTKRGKSSYILSMRAKELALQEGGSSDEKVIL